MSGRIIYPLRSKFKPNFWSRITGGGNREPECPCIHCRKQGECIDYMRYGPVFMDCNDPEK